MTLAQIKKYVTAVDAWVATDPSPTGRTDLIPTSSAFQGDIPDWVDFKGFWWPITWDQTSNVITSP